MDAKELRIGNVIFVDNNIEEVQTFTFYDLNRGAININPIPLTEEWLLKFGFTLDSGVGVWFSTQKHFPIWQAYGSKPYQYTVNNPSDNINISTVHQLQNLYFALTGEELQLK